MIFTPKYTITIEIAKSLVYIEEKKEYFGNQHYSIAAITPYIKASNYISANFSTQIKSNHLKQNDVLKVLILEGDFLDKLQNNQKAKPYYKALEFLKTHQNSEISTELINEIHSILTEATYTSNYRNQQSMIRDSKSGEIVYIPPDAKEIAGLMKSLVLWINGEIKEAKTPLPVIASIAHYQLATIHPYLTGNGRTARLLSKFILEKHGYGLEGFYSSEEYYALDSVIYYRVLATQSILNYNMGRKNADITDFVNYSIKAMAYGIQTAFLILDKKKSNYNQVDFRELHPQQKQILKLFIRQKEISNTEIAKKLKINTRSAAHLVKKWMQLSFLEIANPSNKLRTYKLSDKWEAFIIENT